MYYVFTNVFCKYFMQFPIFSSPEKRNHAPGKTSDKYHERLGEWAEKREGEEERATERGKERDGGRETERERIKRDVRKKIDESSDTGENIKKIRAEWVKYN